MKSRAPDIRKKLWFKLVTLRLVILMLGLGMPYPSSSSDVQASPGAQSTEQSGNLVESALQEVATAVENTKAEVEEAIDSQIEKLIESGPEDLINNCGPLCLLILLLVILGVVYIIIQGLLRLCRMLNRPKKAPDGPDDAMGPNIVGAVNLRPFTLTISEAGMPSINNSYEESLLTITLSDTNAVTGYTTFPGTTNLDGSINVTNLDRSGNPYCALFKFNVLSSTNAYYWSNSTTVCIVKGWISFSGASEQTNGQGGFRINGKPENVLLVCYTNGIVASRAYYPASTTGTNFDPNNIPYLAIPPKQGTSREFFRLMAPPLE